LRDVVHNLNVEVKRLRKRPVPESSVEVAKTTPKAVVRPEQVDTEGPKAKIPHPKQSHKAAQSKSKLPRKVSLSAPQKPLPGNLKKVKIPPLPDRGHVNDPVEFLAQGNRRTTGDNYDVALINKKSNTIVTGSVRANASEEPKSSPQKKTTNVGPPVATFGEITITVAAPSGDADKDLTAAVVLSTSASLDVLRSTWEQLTVKYPLLLGNLEARYDFMGPSDTPYRLISGPLPSHAGARELCTTLARKNIRCSVAEFVGNAL